MVTHAAAERAARSHNRDRPNVIEMLTSQAFVAAAVPSAASVLLAVVAMEWRLRRALGGRSALPAAQVESARAVRDPAPAPPGVRSAPHNGQVAAQVESAGESLPAVGPATAPAPAPAVRTARIHMGPRDQMIEFMRWFIDEEFCGKYPAEEWVKFYRDWARARSISAMTDSQFLTRLGSVGSIRKSRDRVKDAAGRALRNAKGTPLRVTFYDMPQPEVFSGDSGADTHPRSLNGASVAHQQPRLTRRAA